MAGLPSYDELPTRDGVPCSWGVWGPADVFGCLNLLSPERVRSAGRSIERGIVFSLNLAMTVPDPPLFSRAPVRHQVVGAASSRSQDDLLREWNTQSSTQWDGFRHIRREGHGHYGGVSDGEHGVHHWARRGIAGRAVLVDVSRWRASVGRPIVHGTPDPVSADDLVATLRAQEVDVETGDVLLIRTGWLAWYATLDAVQRAQMRTAETLVCPGLRPDGGTARLLWDLHVAAVAADNPALELRPLGALLDPDEVTAIRADAHREHEISLHTQLLPMLGLPIGELFDLEALALDCERDGRYTCFLTSAPINLPAGVATPANALAFK